MWIIWCHQVFKSSDWFLECAFDFFGRNCENKCGKCKGDVRCNVTNGMCLEGCQEHWSYPNCTGKYILWSYITPCHKPEYRMKNVYYVENIIERIPDASLRITQKQIKYTTLLWKWLKMIRHIPLFNIFLGIDCRFP